MASLVGQRIAKRVRVARTRAGLTQAELAEAANVADETVSRIERGAYEPALSTMVAISAALGVTLDDLAGEGEGRDEEPRSARDQSSLATKIARRAVSLDKKTLKAMLKLVEAIGVAEHSATYSGPRKGRPRR